MAERVADFPRSLLLLLQQTGLFQQQAAGLQDLLLQIAGRQVVAIRQDLAFFNDQLTAQFLRHLREIVNHPLILLNTRQRLFAFR
ncbi:hypothetical protein D3C80_1489950 [compost metagenome]